MAVTVCLFWLGQRWQVQDYCRPCSPQAGGSDPHSYCSQNEISGVRNNWTPLLFWTSYTWFHGTAFP